MLATVQMIKGTQVVNWPRWHAKEELRQQGSMPLWNDCSLDYLPLIQHQTLPPKDTQRKKHEIPNAIFTILLNLDSLPWLAIKYPHFCDAFIPQCVASVCPITVVPLEKGEDAKQCCWTLLGSDPQHSLHW